MAHTYRTEIRTTPGDFNGNTQTFMTSEVLNVEGGGSKFASSEDYDNKGTIVRRANGDLKNVYGQADLDDGDVINIDGLQLTVAEARAAGLSFDDGDHVDAVKDSLPPGDVTADEAPELDLRNANSTTDAELATLANIADAAEMHGTGLSQEAVVELGTDILTGELGDNDPIYEGLAARGISKDAVHGTIQNMVEVAQAAAHRELGAAKYNELSRLADASPAIKALVVQHGAKRAMGKASVTYDQVLQLARTFAKR